MTANELQRIATRIGNSCWVRHWLHFNWPLNPCVMAIQAVDWNDEKDDPPIISRKLPEIEKLGFRLSDERTEAAKFIYVIDRTNEDGSPFISQL